MKATSRVPAAWPLAAARGWLAPAGHAPFLRARAFALSPGQLATLLLLAYGVVWLGACALTALSPPVDNLEQLTWQHQLAWGYYKHPPLPTALAWLAVKALGPGAWTTYLLGASLTLASLALFWRLLRTLRGPHYATIALLAALCITFYNGRLDYYNHNVVLMVAVAAAAVACWQAHERRTWGAWALVGVVFGLGMLAKYQMVVTALSAAVFWATQRGWRDPVQRRGALLAVLIALAICVPHVLWLREHGFPPVDYAIESSLGARQSLAESVHGSILWLVDALLNRALPALLLLGVVGMLGTRAAKAQPGAAGQRAGAVPERSARALLLSWGLVPLLFMPAMGVAFGSELQLQWGTPFLLFAVPCAMEMLPARTWQHARLDAALKAFLVLQVLLLVIDLVTSPYGPPALRSRRHWRNVSGAELAARIVEPARLRLGAPVRIIIGPQGEGGTLALQLPGDPLLLIDGRFDRSPWLTPAMVQACGALELAHWKVPPAGWSAVGEPFHALYWRTLAPDRSMPCRT